MTREQRLKLCELSTESFGSAYAWKSYLETPILEKEYDPTLERFHKKTKWRTLPEVIELMGAKYEDVFNDS